MVQRLVLFIAAFVFWLVLDWPMAADGSLKIGNLLAGLAVSAFVALVMRDLATERFGRLLEPARYFWFVIYAVVFALHAVRAGLDVMYRVLHPALPIRPGIVKVRTKLKSASARTALANSITLTPGTLTVDISDEGDFYIHWINVTTDDADAQAAEILGPFEGFIGRIFE